jgi:NTE family protein
VVSGNNVYFDTTTHTIRAEHIMASGALPPGFPAVEIEGQFYWDGGLVSNTPLQWLAQSRPQRDTLAFQVDLWSARGDLPATMAEVATRQKEIQYSSRTRAESTRFKQIQILRHALSTLLEQLPDLPEVDLLKPVAGRKVFNLVELVYRAQQYEDDSKDYEFSPLSMEEHWTARYNDTIRTLRHPEVLQRPHNREGVFIFDIAQHGRE